MCTLAFPHSICKDLHLYVPLRDQRCQPSADYLPVSSSIDMPIEKQFSLLELERKRSVNQLARAWGENGVLRSPETPRLDFERPGLSGKQLISRLLCSAQVGRLFTLAVKIRPVAEKQVQIIDFLQYPRNTMIPNRRD